ncbi:NAD(P)-binding protein [Streptomyces sp. NPDC058291]|uniref:NAD(P)-binding protein n=1 Tax=Streptomyces sp. NPDC058291 TaxID=3346427 RepID=UPI0036E08DF7
MKADVTIVGTGPNGLAAAVVMARAGLRVQLFEGHREIGGGLRTTSLFDADITHDVCAAVHPMTAASRFFREFDLASRGVRLRLPKISYAPPHCPTAQLPWLTTTRARRAAEVPRAQAARPGCVAYLAWPGATRPRTGLTLMCEP